MATTSSLRSQEPRTERKPPRRTEPPRRPEPRRAPADRVEVRRREPEAPRDDKADVGVLIRGLGEWGTEQREERRHATAFHRHFDTFDGAGADNHERDGRVARNDLEALAADRHADPEARQAARHYLDDPESLRALDNAAAEDKTGEGDDHIARADAEAHLRGSHEAVENARIDAFNELRRHPDAERRELIEAQQATRWENRGDVLENLRDNPDLSTYSDEQLLAANRLAGRDAELRGRLQDTTAAYVTERTNSVDDLPSNLGFQQLLQDQVVASDDERVQTARERLGGQVDRAVRRPTRPCKACTANGRKRSRTTGPCKSAFKTSSKPTTTFSRRGCAAWAASWATSSGTPSSSGSRAPPASTPPTWSVKASRSPPGGTGSRACRRTCTRGSAAVPKAWSPA